MDNILLDRPLPADHEVERMVLGAIISDHTQYNSVASEISVEDFNTDLHKRIWLCITDLASNTPDFDRVLIAQKLQLDGKLPPNGLTVLMQMDNGLPEIFTLKNYVTILREYTMRRQIILNAYKISETAYQGVETPQSILREATTNFLTIQATKARTGLQSVSAILQNFPGGISTFLDPTKRTTGIKTGFRRLDDLTGGFREGEYIIIAGRPSMGKTAFAMSIVLNVLNNPHAETPPVAAIFSAEMSSESLIERAVCSNARVDLQKFRAGFVNPEQRHRLNAATAALADQNLMIDDTGAFTVADIGAKLRQLKNDAGHISLVVVDYLQLLSTTGRAENQNQVVTTISKGLLQLAKETGCPFVVLSQLSRAPETRPGDHRPILSDLRESGSIEQDADVVCFVYREEVYHRDREDLKGLAKIIIAKQRNGPIDDVPLVFLKEYARFENSMGDIDEPD